MGTSAYGQKRRSVVTEVSWVADRCGWAGASTYCVGKFGLTCWTRALHAEGEVPSIRVVVHSELTTTNWEDGTPNARSEGEQEGRPSDEALAPEHAVSSFGQPPNGDLDCGGDGGA